MIDNGKQVQTIKLQLGLNDTDQDWLWMIDPTKTNIHIRNF